MPCELGFGSLAMGRLGGGVGGRFHLDGAGRSRDKKLWAVSAVRACNTAVVETLYGAYP